MEMSAAVWQRWCLLAAHTNVRWVLEAQLARQVSCNEQTFSLNFMLSSYIHLQQGGRRLVLVNFVHCGMV